LLDCTARYRAGRGVRRPDGSPVAAPISEKSLAVLPFTDMSEQKDQGYFSDVLSEELIDLLTKVPALRAPARTSSFYFKGKSDDIATIASKLRVANVLEGSVRKSGTHLRVTALLVRADAGYDLWSEASDRTLDDIFKAQDQIAAAVVDALKLKLLAAPTSKNRETSSAEVYDRFLIGQQIIRRDNWLDSPRAIAAFRKALDSDPSYAPARAGISMAAFGVANHEDSAAAIAANQAQALAAADKAVALRADRPDGYAVRGFMRAAAQYNLRGADEDFQRVLQLEPDNVDALLSYASVVLMPMGRLDEALSMVRKVVDVDPLSANSWRRLGVTQFFRGDWSTAREALQRSLDLHPEQSNTAAFLAYTLLFDNDPLAALAPRATSEAVPSASAGIGAAQSGSCTGVAAVLGSVIARQAAGAAIQLAQVYSARRQPDRGFEWLERARGQHDGGLVTVKVDPFLRGLHTDPRFGKLLGELNLPP
jgi:TolB-like protein/Flp pilus assembly protein TadD